MRLQSLERLDVSDVIPASVFNMLGSAVQDVLKQKLI